MVLLMEIFHLLIVFRIIECVIGVSVICTRMLAEMGTRMSMKLVYITVRSETHFCCSCSSLRNDVPYLKYDPDIHIRAQYTFQCFRL